MVQGQVFLKGEARKGLALFLFSFFKVNCFYICKLLYFVQNFVMYLKENYFFCQHNFMKKRYCVNMNLKIFHKLR